MFYFPAQWHDQDAILIAWPHKNTDWNDWLKEANQTYLEVVHCISNHNRVIILVDDCINLDTLKSQLTQQNTNLSKLHFININYNDTWARDFSAITLVDDQHSKTTQTLNFTFNAWGEKFNSNLDNLINSQLQSKHLFSQPIKNIDFILEGGSIETDGHGTLLTTEICLLNKNRNKELSKNKIESNLKQYLNIKRVIWLKNGHLCGDDTDAHIDTLARFTDKNTIVFQGCQNKEDEHYSCLNKMKEELKQLKTLEHKPYRLIELPLPSAQYDKENNRLPASYVNFLISNNCIFTPIYQCKEDKIAINILKESLPNYDIIPINCRTLIEQFGSLHCITMQFPKHSLNLKELQK